jgi:hypothetical protein
MTRLIDQTSEPAKNRIYIHTLCLLIITVSCSNHVSKMNNNFCNALIEKNHQELKDTVDKFLNTLDPKKSNDQNFQFIKNWIEDHECVVKAEFDDTIIDTEPPVKEFAVSLKGISKLYFIGIRVYPDQMKFDMK